MDEQFKYILEKLDKIQEDISEIKLELGKQQGKISMITLFCSAIVSAIVAIVVKFFT